MSICDIEKIKPKQKTSRIKISWCETMNINRKCLYIYYLHCILFKVIRVYFMIFWSENGENSIDFFSMEKSSLCIDVL